MGCLGCLGFLPELILELIFDGYFALMQWIIPQKWISRRFQTVLKAIVCLFTGLLSVIMFLGLLALISDDADTKVLGRYMVCIPLAISFVQILFGIIMRVITRKK